MEASKLRVRVRYAETDRMGYAYYGTYFTWFEVGRVEFLRERGVSYRDLEDSGTFLPVAETSCRYLGPAHYDDELEVTTTLTSCGRSAIVFGASVSRTADGKLLAEGRTRLACAGLDGKPKRIPPELAELLAGAGVPEGGGL
jgi:acyl-CoA thioester hydrolase